MRIDLGLQELIICVRSIQFLLQPENFLTRPKPAMINLPGKRRRKYELEDQTKYPGIQIQPAGDLTGRGHNRHNGEGNDEDYLQEIYPVILLFLHNTGNDPE